MLSTDCKWKVLRVHQLPLRSSQWTTVLRTWSWWMCLQWMQMQARLDWRGLQLWRQWKQLCKPWWVSIYSVCFYARWIMLQKNSFDHSYIRWADWKWAYTTQILVAPNEIDIYCCFPSPLLAHPPIPFSSYESVKIKRVRKAHHSENKTGKEGTSCYILNMLACSFQILETFVQTKENVSATSASVMRQLMADIQANGVKTVR